MTRHIPLVLALVGTASGAAAQEATAEVGPSSQPAGAASGPAPSEAAR